LSERFIKSEGGIKTPFKSQGFFVKTFGKKRKELENVYFLSPFAVGLEPNPIGKRTGVQPESVRVLVINLLLSEDFAKKD
jgi:hypothetical protein